MNGYGPHPVDHATSTDASAFSRRFGARALPNHKRLDKRDAGNAGAAIAPAASHANEESIRVSHHRYAERSGIPCAIVLRLIAGSPRRPGFDCLRHLKVMTLRLDPSIGGPGPHAFAVRADALRHLRIDTSIASRPNVRDDAYAPPIGARCRRDNHMFPENGSKIFFARGLDRPNQIGITREISLSTRVISTTEMACL
jgi:hypothetical protein